MAFQTQIENTVYNPRSVESVDRKHWGYGELTVHLLKKFTYKWTRAVQTHVAEGTTVH